MGKPDARQTPVRLFFALMAKEKEAFEESEAEIARIFGHIDMRDEPYAFDPLTSYYAPEFGTGLTKRIVSVEPLAAPEDLVEIKLRTNALERDMALRAGSGKADPPRVINVDPGYLSLAKVVLASTKDHSHRLYVGRGIFEEITLVYRRKESGFGPMPWTYPDYRMAERLAFFGQLREQYRAQIAAERAATEE